MSQTTDIVIIGAGITGLTLAYYLKGAGKQFVVLEKSDKHGGVIKTIKKDGFLFETGPNTGVIGQPEVVELFDSLGNAIKIEEGNDLVKKRYILKNKKWQVLPHNHKLAVSTPLFTLKDKFRILGEPFRKKGTNPDETLAEMVKRRMGNSFLNYAVDPFILGVYAGDPNKLVTRYALPKLYNLEQDYGSFVKGAIKKKKLPKTELEKKTNRAVFSFEGGLSSLTNAVYDRIGDNYFCFCSDGVVVRPLKDGTFNVSYYQKSEKKNIIANKVITTIGSHGLIDVLPFVEKEWAEKLINLQYARVVEVSIGFKKWKGFDLDGFGLLIPHIEKSNLLGILFMSSLFNNRAPKGGALLTVFMGGVRNDSLCDLSDDIVKKILADEFTSLTGLNEFKPDLLEFKRYSYAIPQYTASTKERLEAVNYLEKKYPGLHIAGNLKDGIGMADRIKQATLLSQIL
ncbi:MAG: protoporphyrinogen oxidase [Marinilabiliaceae bacterium]|nr:protoporphyrinogen oxidase [Marinilabiliaceae bacterium]